MKCTRVLSAIVGVFQIAGAAAWNVSSLSEAKSACSSAKPGDEIVVQDGRYTSGWVLAITCSGTQLQRIVFRAETPGKVVMQGDTRFEIAGDYVTVKGFDFVDVPGYRNGRERPVTIRGNYCHVTQCRFLRCGTWKWRHILFVMPGANHTEISYNNFTDLIGQGIGVNDGSPAAQRTHIHHNHINGVISDGESNGQEPIQLGQAGYTSERFHTLVEYNLIENQGGDGDPEMISIKSRGNTIRYNTLRHTPNGKWREIVFRNAAETVVECNVLFGVGIRVFGVDNVIRRNHIEAVHPDPKYGIRVPRWDGYPNTSKILIEDNIVVNTTGRGIEVATGSSGNSVGTITVRNNICQSDKGILYKLGSPTGPVKWEGNTGWGGAALSSGISGGGITRQDPSLIHENGFWHVPSDTIDAFPLQSSDVGPRWLGGPAVDEAKATLTRPLRVVIPNANVHSSRAGTYLPNGRRVSLAPAVGPGKGAGICTYNNEFGHKSARKVTSVSRRF